MKKYIINTLLTLMVGTTPALANQTQETAMTSNINTKTIRNMSGATPETTLSASKTALIVVDIQNEYFTGKMVIPDRNQVLDQNKTLVNFAHDKGIPVYFVRHLGDADGPLFAEGSIYAEFHKDLQPTEKNIVITKRTPSAFVGTDLNSLLEKKGIKQLIVTGLMTHMCVSSTARDAVPLGYNVIIPEDATATRDLDDGQGGIVNHQILQRSALAGVADVFAEISTTANILKMPVVQ